MSVALRTITRLQDADDINVSLGVGVDEYALVYDHDTAKFVLRAMSAGVTDHGALTGLTTDDDHTQYALLAGRSGGQTLYGGTDANDDITIHGTSNATRTTSYVLLQPTAGNVGIGTAAPGGTLHVSGTTFLNGGLDVGDTAYYDGSVAFSVKSNRAYIFNMYNGSVQPLLFLTQAGVLRLYRGVFQADAEGSHYILGSLGVGTAAPGTRIHALMVDIATNAVTNVVTIGHDTSGTAAAGFGAGLLYQLESSTTAAQDAARIAALWYEATHATRKADLVLTAYDTAEREGLRIRGNGSAAAIGLLGAEPAARIAHVADPAGGGTVDAEARSAINSILATLETFGFHATS